MNSRIYKHHPNIWNFIKFMQNEEKRVQCMAIQWAAGASKKKILEQQLYNIELILFTIDFLIILST